MQAIVNLPWSEPKSILTRRGPKLVKSCEPNEAFWEVWKDYKEEIKAAGISLGNFGGWQLSWWEPFRLPVIQEVESSSKLELQPLKHPEGLLDFQPIIVQHVVYSMKTFGTHLNACDTGLGKTYITLAAARELNLRLLVICPKNIVTDWTEAAKSMGVSLVGVYGWEWIKTGKTPFLSWTYKRVKKKCGDGYVLADAKDRVVWHLPEDVAVVGDEFHRAANADTQNSKMMQDLIELRPQLFMLSATIADNPTKMRACGFALKLHDNSMGWADWQKAHGVVKTRFGHQFNGSKRHLQDIHHEIFPHKGIRVKKSEVPGFPETQIIAKAYDMEESGKIEAIYYEMMAKCQELAEKEAGSACILAEMTRARQRVELLKVPLLVSLTKDSVEEGNSVFLAVNFRDTLAELIKQLDVKCVALGGQKPEHRMKAIADFQSDKERIFVGIIKACREGISLHDLHGNYPRESFIIPPQSPIDLKQVLGRIHRANGKSPSIQRIVYAARTIEEQVSRRLATKLDTMDLITDGAMNEGLFPMGYSDMREDEEELVSADSTPF